MKEGKRTYDDDDDDDDGDGDGLSASSYTIFYFLMFFS